jgi:hypothetical protein
MGRVLESILRKMYIRLTPDLGSSLTCRFLLENLEFEKNKLTLWLLAVEH